MRKDLILNKPIYSSFFSCGPDIQMILKTLFVSSRPHSDILKRLLIINNKDCLKSMDDDTEQVYKKTVNSFSLGDLIDKGYIRLNSKISRGTHEQIKSYILISLDNFSPDGTSAEYRDSIINFDIVCYNDAWVLNNYKIRPLMIAGYIDGILNSLTQNNKYLTTGSLKSQIKLSGIGEYQFLGCNYHVLNEDLAMYTLSYYGKHFSEDVQKIGTVTND